MGVVGGVSKGSGLRLGVRTDPNPKGRVRVGTNPNPKGRVRVREPGPSVRFTTTSSCEVEI